MNKFENLVFDMFHDVKDYDKIAYGLKKLRIVMYDMSEFRRLSITAQFNLCVHICTIIMATEAGTLRDISIFRHEGRYPNKYDIWEGYVKPEILSISKPIKVKKVLIQKLKPGQLLQLSDAPGSTVYELTETKQISQINGDRYFIRRYDDINSVRAIKANTYVFID